MDPRSLQALIPASARTRATIWSTYTLLWQTATAGQSGALATVTTQNDSDFMAAGIRAYVTSTASPPVEQTAPQATVLLMIGSNSLQPDQTPIPLQPFTSNANKMGFWELEYPIYIPRNTTLTGTLTNLSATDYTVRIVFGGVRVLPYDKSPTVFG